MGKTFNRQPFSVSTSKNTFENTGFMTQAQFKGICDDKNAVAVDQQTLADAKNIYIDDTGILTSRPPLKFYDGEAYIAEEWLFGVYGLRLHRLLTSVYHTGDWWPYLIAPDGWMPGDNWPTGNDPLDRPYGTPPYGWSVGDWWPYDAPPANGADYRVDHPQEFMEHRTYDENWQPVQKLYFTFVLRCTTHNTVSGTYNGNTIYGEYGWKISADTIDWDFMPKVTCAQIEDKIFIWFAGLDFIDFNTAGVLMSNGANYPYFESAIKYLYFPIHKLVINGIESDLETKNFLTETYKRRYQYSSLSALNFDKLIGRQVSVNLNGEMTDGRSKYLYEVNIEKNQSKMIVYPYSPIGSNYYVDVVQTKRTTVILRYSAALNIIEISFDGKSYRAMPTIENIVGNPLLTKDGLWVVAFTAKGLAKGKLVAQESIDFLSEENVFSWVVEPYMRNVLVNGFPGYVNEPDTAFVPTGYFETIDNFAYVFSGTSVYGDITGNVQYLYTEWLSGSNDVIWGHTPLITKYGANYANMLPNDSIKVHFRYVSPTTDHQDLGAVVTLMTQGIYQYSNGSLVQSVDGSLTYYFKQVLDNVKRSVSNNDQIFITEILGNPRTSYTGTQGYVYRLTSDGTTLVDEDTALQPTDVVCLSFVPLTVSPTDDYSSTKEYQSGDIISRTRTVTVNGSSITDTFLYKCLQTSTGNDVTDTDYWALMLFGNGTPIYSRPIGAMTNNRYPIGTYGGDTVYIRAQDMTWKMFFLLINNTCRFTWEHTDGAIGVIYPNDRVRFTNINRDVTYTADTLTNVFGTMPTVVDANGTSIDVTTWPAQWPVSKNSPQQVYTGNAVLVGLGNTAITDRIKYTDFNVNVRVDNGDGTTSLYISQGFNSSCAQMDINTMAPTIDAETIKYESIAAYGIKGSRVYNPAAHYIVGDVVINGGHLVKCTAINNSLYTWEELSTPVTRETLPFDCYCKEVYEYISRVVSTDEGALQLVVGGSHWFKIMPNTSTVLTDKYLWVENAIIELPTNGMLAPLVDDNERNLVSDDELLLALKESRDSDALYYDRNIHKLSADGTKLDGTPLKSGDLVSYTAEAITEQDYLQPGEFGGTDVAPTGTKSNRFIIEKLGVDANNEWECVSGYIKLGDLIRLRAYDENITLLADNPGNPYNASLVITPYEYPAMPDGWQLGNDWPADWPTHKPIFANADGTIRFWSPRVIDEWGWEMYPGDPLPTGPILLYGTTNIVKRIRPLSIDGNGVWYNIDGALWTSQLSTDNIIEVDEFINAETRSITDGTGKVVGKARTVDLRTDVPDYFATLDEHYFAFTTRKEGHNLLEITATRRDENKIFSDKGMDLLLYLPEKNEQKFANKITSLHPLSEDAMGIFTESEIWYVRPVSLNDGSIVYTKPIKSKIPVGCSDGNDVITALDGQALIFPTARGLTAMAPQDFVSTTENSLTYLSDAIQDRYHKFYNDTVMSSALMPEEFSKGYKPMIRLVTYKYWLIMYRYMDRQILALDTRTATWWNWEAQYPIKQIIVGARLHFIMEVDFTPMKEYAIVTPVDPASLLGVSFIWTDKEINLTSSDSVAFRNASLNPNADTPISNIGYYDDTVDKTLNGISHWIYENKYIGGRRLVEYARPIIDWYFVSQKLHFGQLNNYKNIYGINTNMTGEDSIIAKLSTKVYRDNYHPEDASVIEIDINDLRTFVKRLNLMHVINFQYRFENDGTKDKDLQKRLKLNSLCIKYSVKEGVR